MLKLISQKLDIVLRKFCEIRSRNALRKIPNLWDELQIYLKKTESTGCGYIDYAELYQMIIDCKPIEVLECGTGVTTLIIAHALMQNELDTGIKGRVTSMEEHNEWFNMSQKLLPSQYFPYVDFVLSSTQDDYYSVFRGVRYSSIPQKEYDFVFVDGPKYKSKIDNGSVFDFDLIYILKNSKKPVSALIDKRVSTVFVLQKLLGTKKVYYSSVKGLGYVLAVKSEDLGNISNNISSLNFSKSFKLFGNSKLEITETETIVG